MKRRALIYICIGLLLTVAIGSAPGNAEARTIKIDAFLVPYWACASGVFVIVRVYEDGQLAHQDAGCLVR